MVFKHLPRPLRRRSAAIGLCALLSLIAGGVAHAQAQQERSGLTLHWGLVPAAVFAEKHTKDELHGGGPKGGGQVHHLVVALYDSASGMRIEDAIVRAQLSEAGINESVPKYLLPMRINEQTSFGQLFGVAKSGPYRFRIYVKLPQRADEIEFAVSAWSQHRSEP